MRGQIEARAVSSGDHPERRGNPGFEPRTGERIGQSCAEPAWIWPRRMRAPANRAYPTSARGDGASIARRSWSLLDRYDFGPVVDGSDLPQHPGEPGAPEIADEIPLMVGGTK